MIWAVIPAATEHEKEAHHGHCVWQWENKNIHLMTQLTIILSPSPRWLTFGIVNVNEAFACVF